MNFIAGIDCDNNHSFSEKLNRITPINAIENPFSDFAMRFCKTLKVCWGNLAIFVLRFGQQRGSVVECLTRDREAAGSSLTNVIALWSMSKTHLS